MADMEKKAVMAGGVAGPERSRNRPTLFMGLLRKIWKRGPMGTEYILDSRRNPTDICISAMPSRYV